MRRKTQSTLKCDHVNAFEIAFTHTHTHTHIYIYIYIYIYIISYTSRRVKLLLLGRLRMTTIRITALLDSKNFALPKYKAAHGDDVLFCWHRSPPTVWYLSAMNSTRQLQVHLIKFWTRHHGKEHSIYLYDGKLFPDSFGIISLKCYTVNCILAPRFHWIDNHESFTYF